MQSIKSYKLIILVTSAAASVIHGKPEQEVWAGPSFRAFSGVCQAVPENLDSPFWQVAVGWNRDGVSWQFAEPEPGTWDAEYLDATYAAIAQFKEHGVETLPMLGYNTSWSSEELSLDVPYEVEYGDRWRREIEVRPNGDYDCRTYTRRSADAPWMLEKTFVIGGFRKNKIPLASYHVQDWENYVRKVVGTLKQAPYEVEYFQVWNEAHPKSGFWDGDLDTYMKRVHLPAANIIHELGGKVVYGGWIHGAPVSELVELLDRHEAWGSIDALDVHYMTPMAFAELREAAVARGRGDMGIWQTELANSPNPGWISNNYPRFLYWALTNDWDYADKYKLFFFSYKNPRLSERETSKDRTFFTGDRLSAHGHSIIALARLLEGQNMASYSGLTATPALGPELHPGKKSLEAFRIDNRVVVAVHMDGSLYADLAVVNGVKAIDLHFKNLGGAVESVSRVDIAGQKTDLTGGLKITDDGVSISVPVANDPQSPAMEWIRESRGPQTFYVEVIHKN